MNDAATEAKVARVEPTPTNVDQVGQNIADSDDLDGEPAPAKATAPSNGDNSAANKTQS